MNFDFTTLKNNLLSKGYHVSVFETKEEAASYLDSQIHERTVGFGGSLTLTEMNLFNILSTHNTVYWHDKSRNESAEIFLFCGVNLLGLSTRSF